MTVIEWFSLAVVCFLGAATPGPSLAIILGHTIQADKFAGQIASFSHAFAILIYAVASIFGLVKLFETYPSLAKALTYAGATYLLYLAYKTFVASIELRQALKDSSNEESGLPDSCEASDDNTSAKADNTNAHNTNNEAAYRAAAKDAFLIAFLNPKLAIFFMALFSQFIPLDNISIPIILILAGTVFFIDLFWYLFVVAIITKHKSKLLDNTQRQIWFLQSQAVIFTLIAINSVVWR